MNIVFLQTATGDEVVGPTVRVPFGNYRVEKSGRFRECEMHLDDRGPINVNSRIILSKNSSIRMVAREAQGLTVRFIRES